MSKRSDFVSSLTRLSAEIKDEGLEAVDIEEGELCWMLEKAAKLIEEFAPEDLK